MLLEKITPGNLLEEFPDENQATVWAVELIKKLDRFIEISGFDRQRIIGWLFSKAVLAAW